MKPLTEDQFARFVEDAQVFFSKVFNQEFMQGLVAYVEQLRDCRDQALSAQENSGIFGRIAARATMERNALRARHSQHCRIIHALEELLLCGQSFKVHDLAHEDSWVVDDLSVVKKARAALEDYQAEDQQ